MTDHQKAQEQIALAKQEEVLNAKPSQLLRMAVDDLEACEKSPKYSIDMGEWVKPSGKVCLVCLGGSVLAQRFDIKRYWNGDDRRVLSGNDTKAERMRNIAHALNAFRVGCIRYGLRYLGIENIPKCVPENTARAPQAYETDPTIFKEEMRCIAERLEEVGL